MVRHIVNCKTKADVEPAKKLVEEQGGKIVDTYTLIPAFVVDMPKDSVSAFESSPHIETVELDSEVKTQG
ncbi:uncharacterized protein LY89DRAFT_734740 [Mollisia scopiformis]|uniref:Inhibitor I9 domain-containing protein n=1 Tax=Mollisia scopiformis TaxID=149040 RepID=A0A194X900_MOLSC|nr:uncharacterized protein LY89DRAFT_734740 [Mollisia scopiformis]KUJ16646.1 hypothetical protein LY89DRAFT_734740 [Mollisia scopiformis]